MLSFILFVDHHLFISIQVILFSIFTTYDVFQLGMCSFSENDEYDLNFYLFTDQKRAMG